MKPMPPSLVGSPELSAAGAAASPRDPGPRWLGSGWLALLFGGFGFGVNLVQLSRPAPWRDEAASWISGQRSPGELLAMLGHIDAVHGGYYFLLCGWERLFGDSILSLRLVSAVAVGLTAGLVFLLARELFGAAGAPWAGLLAALLPASTWAATEARSFALSCAAVTAAMLALAVALRRDTGWTWALWAVSAVVSIHLFLYSGLAFVGLLPALFAIPAKVRRHALVAGAAVLACCLPFTLEVVSQGGQLAWLSRHQLTLAEVTVQTFWRYDQPTGWIGSALLLVGLVVLLATLRDAALRPAIFLVVGWLVGPPLILAAANLFRPVYLARYLTFTVGALALVFGFLIGRLPRLWLRGAAATLLCLLLVPSFLQAREVYSKDTSFGAYLRLQQVARPGDGVLPLGADTDQPFWAFRSRMAGLVDLGQDPDPSWRSVRLYPAPRTADAVAAAGPRRIWLLTKQALPSPALRAATAAFEGAGYRPEQPIELSSDLVAVLVERS